MQAILLLLPQILTALPLVTTAADKLIAWITAVRTAAIATGEWTADLEAAFVAALIARSKSKAYMTDAQIDALVLAGN